jgi:hypothetical protein
MRITEIAEIPSLTAIRIAAVSAAKESIIANATNGDIRDCFGSIVISACISSNTHNGFALSDQN